METSFAKYIGEVLGLGSVDHYATSVRTASRYLRDKGLIDGELFEIDSLARLKELRDVLYGDNGFISQDSTGNRMYSVGLNHFVDFIGLEKSEFESREHRLLSVEDIEKLDAPVDVPTRAPRVVYGWNRDRVIVEQILKADRWQCEVDSTHKTFIARANDKSYLEGHHLIPISRQGDFSKSLDVYSNIIGLCPNCHRLFHFGRTSEIRELLKSIYDKRAPRLEKSGILVSKEEFLTLAAG